MRLVLVGRDEGDAQAIASFVDRHGLSDEVEVTGEVTDEELARWYARTDFFALFSHYEAFGLVFFEAMTHGAPVLTHDVGANRELLHRGAVVVPRFDQQAAAEALTSLVNDDAERQRLSARRPRLRPGRVHLARSGGEVPGSVWGSGLTLGPHSAVGDITLLGEIRYEG